VPTQPQRIDKLEENVQDISTKLTRFQEIARLTEGAFATRLAGIEDAIKQLQVDVADIGKGVARLDERLKTLEKHVDHPATLSAHDQRLKALEKGSDRTWQFAAMGISVVAILVSLVVAFVKK